MLHVLLVIVHVLICFALATVILLQSSKGGGLAGAFGGAGGAPQQLLGSRGMTSLMHKMTIYLAVGFFATSFLLFMTQGTGTNSVSNVVGKAAQSGQLNLPVQGNPLPDAVPIVPDAGAGKTEPKTSDASGEGSQSQ